MILGVVFGFRSLMTAGFTDADNFLTATLDSPSFLAC